MDVLYITCSSILSQISYYFLFFCLIPFSSFSDSISILYFVIPKNICIEMFRWILHFLSCVSSKKKFTECWIIFKNIWWSEFGGAGEGTHISAHLGKFGNSVHSQKTNIFIAMNFAQLLGIQWLRDNLFPALIWLGDTEIQGFEHLQYDYPFGKSKYPAVQFCLNKSRLWLSRHFWLKFSRNLWWSFFLLHSFTCFCTSELCCGNC